MVTDATLTAADTLNFALDESPSGTVTLIVFSGGAQAINRYFQDNHVDASKIDYVVYVSPGFGTGQGANFLRGTKGTIFIYNPDSLEDWAANWGAGTQPDDLRKDKTIDLEVTTCEHDFACVLRQFNFLIAPRLGQPCTHDQIFVPTDYHVSGGLAPGPGPGKPVNQSMFCRLFGAPWCSPVPVE